MTKNYSEIGNHIIIMENKHDANLICVELDEGLVFIDTGRRYDVAEDFRREMELRFGKKASHLFITHYHFDHYGGIAAFKDITVISSKEGYKQFVTDAKFHLTKEKRKNYVKKWKEQAEIHNVNISENRKIHWEYYPKAELYPSSMTAINEYELGSNDRKLIFKVTGGHSKCSAYIYDPVEEVIFIGDNLATDPEKGEEGSLGYSMQFYRNGLNERTLEVLKEIESLPVKIIVPGHGPSVTLNYVSEIRNYFESLFNEFRKIYEEDMSIESISENKGLHKYKDPELENWENIIKQQYNTFVKDEIKRELKVKQQKLLKSIYAKNLNSFLEVYTENSEFIFPNEFSIKGKDILRENHPGFNQVISQAYNAEQYHFLENKIVETGKYTAQFESDEDLLEYEKQYIYSWVKEDNEWRIMTDMTISEEVN